MATDAEAEVVVVATAVEVVVTETDSAVTDDLLEEEGRNTKHVSAGMSARIF